MPNGQTIIHSALKYAAFTFVVFRLGLLRSTLTGLNVAAVDPNNPTNPRAVVYQ